MITYIIPTCNNADTIEDCVMSIMAKHASLKDFEIIIVDDDSADGILENKYPNIKIFENDKHNSIIESINFGIYEADGDYITFIDPSQRHISDDILTSYKILQGATDYDLITTTDYNVWGTVIRREAIANHTFHLEAYWWGVELRRMIKKYNLKATIYDGDFQIDNRLSQSDLYEQNQRLDKVYRTNWRETPENNEFTAIITFKNEGDEIERTVSSIRATASTPINIIIVDDGSDDGYDYSNVAFHYNCQLFRTDGLGIARARDYGVSQCVTPYFVILDAHMRFYSDGWDTELLTTAKLNPEAIITTDNVYIERNSYDLLYKNEDGNKRTVVAAGNAAIVNFDTHPFTCNFNKFKPQTHHKLQSVPCPLGAVYCTNKKWWSYIGGLKGLLGWGLDEPLMAIKTYLCGGSILLNKAPVIGHLYRKFATYSTKYPHIISNQIYLINLLCDHSAQREKYLEILKNETEKEIYEDGLKIYNEYWADGMGEDIKSLNEKKKRTLSDFLIFNKNVQQTKL